MSTGSAVVNFFPILENLPGDPFSARELHRQTAVMDSEFFLPQIAKYKATYSHTEEPANFIHAYLRHMNDLQHSDTQTSLNGNKDLISFRPSIRQIFLIKDL
jgi:hypothetical protein